MILIRNAEKKDLNNLYALLNALDLQEADFSYRNTIIAEDNNKLIGLAHLREIENIKELTHVGVLPKYRRQGIASKLVKKIILNTNEDIFLNTIMPEFFEKLGFEQTNKISTQFKKTKAWCLACNPEKCTAMIKKYKS